MDKKELAALLRKLEAMQASMVIMQREMAEIAARLRFIPVSESSDVSSDSDLEDASSGMKP